MDRSAADHLVFYSSVTLSLLCLLWRSCGRSTSPAQPAQAMQKVQGPRWHWRILLGLGACGCGAGIFYVWSIASPQHWQKFHSERGGFSLDLPGANQEEDYPLHVDGQAVTAHRIAAEDHWRHQTYAAFYRDLLPHDHVDPEQVVATLAGKLRGPNDDHLVCVDGYIGHELIGHTTDGYCVNARVFENPAQMVFIFEMVPEADAGEPEVQQFIQSFHFDFSATGQLTSADAK